ncbi:MAG: flippase-like domain-containing protein [Bacteroidales bacterium]|nr:flippase-like domain-containing protein [Bacteroidales bacterium]
MNKKKKLIFMLLHGVGFVLLYFVLKDLDWKLFWNLLNQFPVYKFLVGLIMLLAVYVLKSLRWFLINRSFEIDLPFAHTFVFYLVSGFLSVITPGRLGELAKVFFIQKRNKISYTQAFSSVILDRIWDVMVLSMMAGISLVFLFSDFKLSILGISVIAFFLAFSFGIIVYPGLLFKPLLLFTRRFSNLNSEIGKIYSLWSGKRIRFFIPSLFLSIGAFLILSLIPLLFAEEINARVPFSAAISAISISNILSFIPVTIAGFGTREYVFVEIWKLFSHSKEVALTLSAAQFFCTYLGSLFLGGAVYLIGFRKYFSRKEVENIKNIYQ